jgi:hypothetical protein
MRQWKNTAIAVGLMLTFTVCGLWHGAAWTYIFFGFLHGIIITYEYLTKKQRKKLFNKLPGWLATGLSKFFTFGFFAFSCIFFRANNLPDAFYIVKKLCAVPAETMHALKAHTVSFLTLPQTSLLAGCLALIIILELYHKLTSKHNLIEAFAKSPQYLRWAFYFILLNAIIFCGVFEQRQFIYFQF